MNRMLRLAAVMTLTALVTACGFHLRGRVPLHESLSLVAVVGKDQELRAAVADALRLGGASVVEDSRQAKAVLEIRNAKYERRVRTLDNRGKASSYRLFYTAEYGLTTSDGTSLVKGRTASVSRDFDFGADQVLAKENEERELREEMIEDLAQQMVRQVNAAARRASRTLPLKGS